MSEFYTSTDHFVLLPALLLALFGCATLLFDFWVFPKPYFDILEKPVAQIVERVNGQRTAPVLAEIPRPESEAR